MSHSFMSKLMSHPSMSHLMSYPSMSQFMSHRSMSQLSCLIHACLNSCLVHTYLNSCLIHPCLNSCLIHLWLDLIYQVFQISKFFRHYFCSLYIIFYKEIYSFSTFLARKFYIPYRVMLRNKFSIQMSGATLKR